MPGPDLKTFGRRPHKHNDRENDYIPERVHLGPRLGRETGQTVVLSVKDLPTLVAYPNHAFDYDNQSRRGDNGKRPGHTRIVTDGKKHQVGVPYHPFGNTKEMVRAEAGGVFIADYRRDSIKDSQETKRQSAPGSRSSTWPKR